MCYGENFVDVMFTVCGWTVQVVARYHNVTYVRINVLPIHENEDFQALFRDLLLHYQLESVSN